MYLAPVDGAEALRLLQNGALLVDIRDGDERADMRIPGSIHASVNQPLPRLADADVPAVVFHCSCGRRAEDNAYRLRELTDAPAYMLRGGLEAWVEDGLPVVTRSRLATALDRHVPKLMGGLALAGGTILGLVYGPGSKAFSVVTGLR